MKASWRPRFEILFLIISIGILIYINTDRYWSRTESVRLTGIIDEVCTPVEELIAVNKEINPILNSLKFSEFFRIFRVNLESECPFWNSQGNWVTSKWAVGECTNDEVPDEWRQWDQTFNVERDLHKNEVTLIHSYLQNMKTSEWMKIEEQTGKTKRVNF